MGTVWGIFWHDLRQLLRNPLALATVVGMVLASAAIAWYAVAVLWSPYQHADCLSVAVVDNDEGDAVESLGALDVGALVTEAVRADRSFNWDVVDEQTARDGLESGRYYAAIIMPPDFTREFASVLKGGTVGEPTLEYLASQKRNASAPEASQAGTSAIDAAVSSAFTAIVSQAATQAAQGEVAPAVEGEDGAASPTDANLGSAEARIKSATDAFDTADEAIGKWRDEVKKTQQSMDALSAALPDVRTSVSDTLTALADARTAAHKVGGTASSLVGEGGKGIVSTVKDIADKVAAVAESVEGVEEQVISASEVARDALERNREALDALESIDDPPNDVSTAIDSLRTKNDELDKAVDALDATSETVADSISDAAEGAQSASETMTAISEGIGKVEGSFNSEILPKLDTSMDSVALLLGSLEEAIDDQELRISQAKAFLSDLDDVFKQTGNALDDTKDALAAASANVAATRTALSAVADSEFVKKASEFAGVDAQTYGAFMAAPVTTKVQAVYSPGSYSAAAAPFYTCLALWVFAFMIVAVFKLEADPTLFANTRPWQAYLGRLLLFVLLALVQALVVCVGELLLGVGAVNPVAFVCAALACAFAFVNVVLALAVVLKHAGKALALLLLAVQIPASWGAFPVQLAPDVFRAVRSFLPFTYGVDAMGEAIGGFYGNVYGFDLLWLLGFAVVVLVVALLLRPQVISLNRLFDEKLEEADVFLTERHGLGAAVRQNMPGMQSMLEDEALRGDALVRARAFERRYAILKRVVPAAVVLVPVAMVAAMSLLGADADADGKVFMLLLLVAAVAVLFILAAALEYTHGTLSRQLKAASASSVPGGYAPASRSGQARGAVRTAPAGDVPVRANRADDPPTRTARTNGAPARTIRAGDASAQTAHFEAAVRDVPAVDETAQRAASDAARTGASQDFAQVKPLVSGRAMQVPKGARRSGAVVSNRAAGVRSAKSGLPDGQGAKPASGKHGVAGRGADAGGIEAGAGKHSAGRHSAGGRGWRRP